MGGVFISCFCPTLQARKQGLRDGRKEGKHDGRDEGRRGADKMIERAEKRGYEEGLQRGRRRGQRERRERNRKQSQKHGFDAGRWQGYVDGSKAVHNLSSVTRDKSYVRGWEEGRFMEPHMTRHRRRKTRKRLKRRMSRERSKTLVNRTYSKGVKRKRRLEKSVSAFSDQFWRDRAWVY